MALTSMEQFALSIVESEHARARGSVTAEYVAARAAEKLGGDQSTRRWSIVLSSLARKEKIEALANGFVNKTFYMPRRANDRVA